MRPVFLIRAMIQRELDPSCDIGSLFERHAAPRIAEQRNYRFGLHIRGIIRGFHRGVVRIFGLSFNIQPDTCDLRHLRADKVCSKGRVLFQCNVETFARGIRSPAPAGKAIVLIGCRGDVPCVAGNIRRLDGTHVRAAIGHFDRGLINLAEVRRPRFVLRERYRVRVIREFFLRTSGNSLLPIIKHITVCRACGQCVLIVASRPTCNGTLCRVSRSYLKRVVFSKTL